MCLPEDKTIRKIIPSSLAMLKHFEKPSKLVYISGTLRQLSAMMKIKGLRCLGKKHVFACSENNHTYYAKLSGDIKNLHNVLETVLHITIDEIDSMSLLDFLLLSSC